MNAQIKPTPIPETQATLDCLRQAVTNALARKQRLGQYAIVWSENGPVAVGADAPVELVSPRVNGESPT